MDRILELQDYLDKVAGEDGFDEETVISPILQELGDFDAGTSFCIPFPRNFADISW